MWALPARSMPGSEMLFVENTRIRGTKVSPGVRGSVATGAVIGCELLVGSSERAAGREVGGVASRPGSGLLAADDEDAVVAVGGHGPEELVAHLGGTGPDVGLR